MSCPLLATSGDFEFCGYWLVFMLVIEENLCCLPNCPAMTILIS